MNYDLLIGIGGAVLVCVGMLFLSGIQVFMVPKDILERDTKARKPRETSDDKTGSDSGAKTDVPEGTVGD